MLSRIQNTYGLKIHSGDFKIIKKNILRNKCKNEGLVYTGAQIIDTDVFDLFNGFLSPPQRTCSATENNRELARIGAINGDIL